MDRHLLILPLFLLIALSFTSSAFAATSNDVKNSIDNSVSSIVKHGWTEAKGATNDLVKGNWSIIDKFSLSLRPNSTDLSDFSISVVGNESYIPVVVNGTIVNGTQIPPSHECPSGSTWNGTACNPNTPPPQKQEICGDGIDNDDDGLVDEGCPVKPPEPPKDNPAQVVNTTKTIRVGVVADIDTNNGLKTQLALAKKYNVEVLIIAGDYGYSNCQSIVDNYLKPAGFTKENTAIVQGNHDCSSVTKAFNGLSNLYGEAVLGNDRINGYLGIFMIDANQGFGCSTTQFTSLKDQIESSDAYYNLGVVHQPFVTVKSHHPPNGQFDCWNPLFAGNGMDLILQGHNHNYQRFDINGITYLVAGTGTHDQGSSMYSLDSNSWNGFDCKKCITGTNGITLLDFQVDDPATRHMDGWFLSNSGDVKDKFN